MVWGGGNAKLRAHLSQTPKTQVLIDRGKTQKLFNENNQNNLL